MGDPVVGVDSERHAVSGGECREQQFRKSAVRFVGRDGEQKFIALDLREEIASLDRNDVVSGSHRSVQKPGESLPTQTTGKIQLVNASTGKPLSITFGTAPNTKVIDEFYTEDGPTGDVLGLVFYEGGVRYQLGGVSTTGTTQDNLTYGQYSSPSGIYFAGLEAEEIPEVASKQNK